MSDEMKRIRPAEEETLILLGNVIKIICQNAGFNYVTFDISPEKLYAVGYEDYQQRNGKGWTGKTYINERWEDLNVGYE